MASLLLEHPFGRSSNQVMSVQKFRECNPPKPKLYSTRIPERLVQNEISFCSDSFFWQAQKNEDARRLGQRALRGGKVQDLWVRR
jgi:hypothetical protein